MVRKQETIDHRKRKTEINFSDESKVAFLKSAVRLNVVSPCPFHTSSREEDSVRQQFILGLRNFVANLDLLRLCAFGRHGFAQIWWLEAQKHLRGLGLSLHLR